MYNNIGEKLKAIAKVLAIIGIVGSVISGIVLMLTGMIGAGFITIISGSLVSWISSWGMYAIGDTNVKVTEMNSRLSRIASQSNSANRTNNFSGGSGNYTHLFRCGKCGTMISDYPCGNCGFEPEKARPEAAGEKEMKCPKCGLVQPVGRKCCFHCGVLFDADAEE